MAISKKEPFIRSMTNGGSSSGGLGTLDEEKRDILIKLWEIGCLNEFFLLGSSNREWSSIQASLKDRLTYLWPRFSLRKGYKLQLKSLLPMQWGDNKETFAKTIKPLLSFRDKDLLYTSMINKSTLLYDYIYGILYMLYNSAVVENDTYKIIYNYESLKITVELFSFTKFQEIFEQRAMVPNDIDPDLYEDYMDKRRFFAMLRYLDISTEKKYTLPELCETLFKKLVIDVSVSSHRSPGANEYKQYRTYKLYTSSVAQRTKSYLFADFIKMP